MLFNLSYNSLAVLFAAGATGLVVLLIYLINFRAAFVLLGALLFFSSLGVFVHSYTHARNQIWLAPLQEYRSGISTAIATMLLIGMLVHRRHLTARKRSMQGIMYLVMAVYAGVLRMGHEDVLSGVISIVQAILMLVPLLFVVPNLLRGWEDYETMLRTVMYTMLVWCAATFLQVFIDREQLFSSSGPHMEYRFMGLTPNPQTAGLLLSLTGSIGMWLILNGRRGFSKLVAIGVTGSILVMLLWTGSRTGAAMFLIMAAAVFYSRMGRAVLWLPVVAVITYALWSYATNTLDVDTGLTHLASSQNTRAEGWKAMWEVGLENLLFGVGADETPATENSLLFGFAAYGIGMVALILLMMGISAVHMIRLVRIRHLLLPEQKRLVDLVIGFNAAYFAGSFFEAFMLGRVNLVTVLFFIFGGMSTQILETVGSPQEPSAPLEYSDETRELTA